MIHTRVSRNSAGDLTSIHISATEDSMANLAQLIDRALNCWDNAPKELKELGDMLTHGRVTQDHTFSKINSRPESNSEYHTAAEIAIIQTYIANNGNEVWLEHIRNGTQGKVMRQES